MFQLRLSRPVAGRLTQTSYGVVSTSTQSMSPAAFWPGGANVCSPRGFRGAAKAGRVSPVVGSNQRALTAPGKRSRATVMTVPEWVKARACLASGVMAAAVVPANPLVSGDI